MNAAADFQLAAADAQVLAGILAPLSPEAPSGEPVRFDPVFTELRLLRQEDDARLPMGQWERPLRQADWAAIESRCVEMLSTRSKHLQIGVWLVEAWTRQRGLAGLSLGLSMLENLLRQYWTTLHPQIDDDGDLDLRMAPLEWLNESLSLGVRVHAVLLPLDGHKPTALTLAEWERMGAQEMADTTDQGRVQRSMGRLSAAQDNAAGVPVTRADVCAIAGESGAWLRASRHSVGQCLVSVDAMDSILQQEAGPDAPRLQRLRATLEAVERALAQLGAEVATPALEANDSVAGGASVHGEDDGAAIPVAPASAPVPAGDRWRNRAEAYATLEALAAFLLEVEPHSPVPFLIRRALHWGSMPLPELIAEILREEGDLNRLVGVLGLKL